MKRRMVGLLGLACLAMGSFPLVAGAVETRLVSGQIKACSKYQSGKCTTGDVRTTSQGKQVRLKGGTWIWCSGDCRDALRAATVDFWMEQKLSN